MTVVSTLATVNISKSLDVNGHEIPVEVKRSGTPVRYEFVFPLGPFNDVRLMSILCFSVPLDFECRFEPRSAEAVTLARDATA